MVSFKLTKLDDLFILGLMNTIFGIISFFPIVLEAHKTKDTSNFPAISLFLSLSSNLLWILYGVFKKAYATAIMGLCFSCMYGYILFIKFINKKKL